jgi:hypothetical protein
LFYVSKAQLRKGVKACKNDQRQANLFINDISGSSNRRSASPRICFNGPSFGFHSTDLSAVLMISRASLPARYPPVGAWPALMRADMAAAYLDYRDTNELARAVLRGETPLPSGYHGRGRSREPVWSKAVIDNFTAKSGGLHLNGTEGEDLSSLV